MSLHFPLPAPAVISSPLTQSCSAHVPLPKEGGTLFLCSLVPGYSHQHSLAESAQCPLGFGGAMATPGSGSRAEGDVEVTSPLWATRMGHVDVGQEPGGWDGRGGTQKMVKWRCCSEVWDGIGWPVMLPARRTTPPLGGLSLVLVGLVCDCRETPWGRCPALCRPRTRRATGVTPPTPMGASSPQTHWAKCSRQPPGLPPGPASLVLAVLRCLCAAEPWLCRVALAPCCGQTLTGGAQALLSLLPPLF